MKVRQALTFDDVLLSPLKSDILPSQVNLDTFLTEEISLKNPLISAAMDTVTEANLAIAMAQSGSIGVVHKNMTIEEQCDQVRLVKKYEAGMVHDPITITPDRPLSDALNLMKTENISGIPVVEEKTKKLLGILTNRDVRFAQQLEKPISEFMTSKDLITVTKDISNHEAKQYLHRHRIEKLLVVDDNYCCIGLVTVKDIIKAEQHPNSCKDSKGCLRVAAATGVGQKGIDRAFELIHSGVDAIVVDTAHGHSRGVIETVKTIRKAYKNIQIIAGNVATGDAAKALIKAGANAIKVGIGPGSICTTRVVAGVGVPQLTAVMDVASVCKKKKVGVIADGGIRSSGDISKAIAAGADTVMIGSLFAGTEESPGEVYYYKGRAYKTYRGMGSIGAMSRGSADRYFQQDVKNQMKFVPEGIEGQVPYKGSVTQVIEQLIGGLKASMGYTGNETISSMQKHCEFIQITSSGIRESHVHDVEITKEAPNYWK